jgi:hypothetical protein
VWWPFAAGWTSSLDSAGAQDMARTNYAPALPYNRLVGAATPMRRNRHTFFLILVTSLACGSGSNTQTLSKGEVTGLPSGNSAGTSFAGTYVIGASLDLVLSLTAVGTVENQY